MAYFLGIKQYGTLKPIELVDENENKIPNKILDIMHFTTQFNSEDELKEYLLRKRLIANYSVDLCYLISKGNKDNRYYEIINMGDHVYTKSAQSFLSIQNIKQYINDNKYSDGFMDHLYSFFLRKYSLLSMAIKRFTSRAYDYYQLSEWLNEMLSMNFSDDFKNYIDQILNFIDDPKVTVKNRYLSLTKAEEICYQNLIDSIGYVICQDDNDVRKFVNFFKKYIKYPSIPAIAYLEKMHSMSYYHNTFGVQAVDSYDDLEDIRTYVDKFISALLYTYDSSIRDYKKINGVYKVNERNLCDLAMILATYDDYINCIDYHMEYPNTSKNEERDDDYSDEDDKEEFLEPEDFARNDMDYREFGYNLHYGDGSEW